MGLNVVWSRSMAHTTFTRRRVRAMTVDTTTGGINVQEGSRHPRGPLFLRRLRRLRVRGEQGGHAQEPQLQSHWNRGQGVHDPSEHGAVHDHQYIVLLTDARLDPNPGER